jgi:hypothetical protein
MASDSQEAVRAAIITTLRADSALQTATGATPARVWNHVPQTEWEKPNAAGLFLPYVVVMGSIGTHFDTKTSDGMEQTVNIHSFSRGRGEKEINDMGEAIIDAIDQVALTVTGHDLVELVFDNHISMLEDDGLTYHLVQRFKATTSAS